MDTELLVDSRTEDGRKLLAELMRDGFHVTVAFWVKTSEEGLWALYVASDAVDPARIGDAYPTVYACLRRIPEASVEPSEIKLIPASHPLAAAAQEVRDRDRGRMPIRLHGKRLGDLSVEEVYVYPPPGLVVLAEGRQAVLEYLEKEALK